MAQETLEERMPQLFQPDVILPEQYFALLRHRTSPEGEKLLIFTVLQDAVECYMKYVDTKNKRKQRLFREAEEWINREDRVSPFSFDNVCEALDLDPVYMREGLRRWKERKLEALHKAKSRSESKMPASVDPPQPGLIERRLVAAARSIWRSAGSKTVAAARS
jgi:hypothetical protein